MSFDPHINRVTQFCGTDLCEKVERAAIELGGVDIRTKHRQAQVRWVPRGLNEDCDEIICSLAKLVGRPATHAEPLQLTLYKSYDFYGYHYDTYGQDAEGRRARSTHGERIVTALVYIRAPDSGGATFFPKLNLRIPSDARERPGLSPMP